MTTRSANACQPPSDEELLDRAVHGDSAALEQLLGRHVPRIAAWLSRNGVDNREDTDELIQSVRVGIHQAATSRRTGAGTPILDFERYLWAVVRHKHADYCTARTRRRRLINDQVSYETAACAESCSPPPQLGAKQLVRLALDIVNQPGSPYRFKIQPTDARMLQLWLDDRTYKEIGEEIEMSSSGVGDRINKYLDRLPKMAATYLETLDQIFEERGEEYQ